MAICQFVRNAILLLALINLFGCSQSGESHVKSNFRPPSIDRLSEVDTADCEYKSGIVEIEGIISPVSQGGWPHSDEYEVHFFSFSAWRFPGQSLVNKELTILRPVAPETDYFSEFPKLSFHRIRVMISTDETRAIFAGKAAQPADTRGLDEVANELSKPVVMKSERFGNLTLDRSIGWFEAKAEWNGKLLRVCFHTGENLDVSASREVAEKLWDSQASWKQKVDNFAVQELLQIKNDSWLNDNDPVVTADQFKSKMTLQSISIYPDGRIEFWHADGDLFWGHSILISGSLDQGLTQADIAG